MRTDSTTGTLVVIAVAWGTIADARGQEVDDRPETVLLGAPSNLWPAIAVSMVPHRALLPRGRGVVHVKTGEAGGTQQWETLPMRVRASGKAEPPAAPPGYQYRVSRRRKDGSVEYLLVRRPSARPPVLPVDTLSKGPFQPVNLQLLRIVNEYNRRVGLPDMDTTRAQAIDARSLIVTARNYEAIPPGPYTAELLRAYREFAAELVRQFEFIQSSGFRMLPWTGEGVAYHSSADMSRDAREHGFVHFDLTTNHLGPDGAGGEDEQYPLLAYSGLEVNGIRLRYNDVFRAVHEAVHALIGANYGPTGEASAWRTHLQMTVSKLARRVMTTELRGQNAFTNAGPHMVNSDGTIKRKGQPGYLPIAQRPFARQRAGFLPAGTEIPVVQNGILKDGALLRRAPGSRHLVVPQQMVFPLASRGHPRRQRGVR
jgi:hypothetical protein